MFGRCPRRLQDRAGEPADRSRDMLKLARPCRPSLASTRSWGVLKRKTKKGTSISRSGDTRFGLGQLLRARIRPMAGDSPSGYSLTGQSGLVFDVESHTASCPPDPTLRRRSPISIGRRPERAAALTSGNLHSLNGLHALLHMELAERRKTQGMCHRCTQNWVACQKCGTKRPAGRAGCGHAWLGGKACGAPRLGRSVLVPSSAYPGTGMRGAQGQFDQRKCGEPGAAVTRIHSLRSRF